MVFLTLVAGVVGSTAPAEPPLLERLLVAISGPAVGAILGTGIIGLIVWKTTDRVQSQREAANLALERERADRALETQLRMDVMTAAFTTAGRWSLELIRFRRLNSDASVKPAAKLKARGDLDNQYVDCRAAALVLEARLEAVFESPGPSIVWHQVNDLLAVRYMSAIGLTTNSTYETNAIDPKGKKHSGLTADELRDDDLVYRTYLSAMKELKGLLLTTSVIGIHRGGEDPAKGKPGH